MPRKSQKGGFLDSITGMLKGINPLADPSIEDLQKKEKEAQQALIEAQRKVREAQSKSGQQSAMPTGPMQMGPMPTEQNAVQNQPQMGGRRSRRRRSRRQRLTRSFFRR